MPRGPNCRGTAARRHSRSRRMCRPAGSSSGIRGETAPNCRRWPVRMRHSRLRSVASMRASASTPEPESGASRRCGRSSERRSAGAIDDVSTRSTRYALVTRSASHHAAAGRRVRHPAGPDRHRSRTQPAAWLEIFYAAEATLEHAVAEIPPGVSFDAVRPGPDQLGVPGRLRFPFRMMSLPSFPRSPLRYEVEVNAVRADLLRVVSAAVAAP